MTEKKLKIVFIVLAGLMLAAMLLISRDAGISGDEEVHYKHSEMVYNYFSTWGKDKSALDTPKTHLQYYGQAFDNLVTFGSHWFKIEDIYSFRHLMCSFSGWLTILITALFAAYFAGYGAAILVLILFAASPTFLGHSQNNLKDVPFALAYIASLFYSVKLIFSEGKPSRKTILFLILSLAFSVGIRPGGLLSIFYFGFFVFLKFLIEWINSRQPEPKIVGKHILMYAGIALAGYLLALTIWPYALQNPVVNVWKSYQVMTHFPTTVRQIFEGRFYWSDFHPWYYLPQYMGITIPLIIFAGLIIFFFTLRKVYTKPQRIQLALIGFTIVFPIAFVVLKGSNLYGSWRHFLFVYPGIVLISALGFHAIFKHFQHKLIRTGAIISLMVLIIHPVKFMAVNHPYYYLYYNQLTGGLKGAYGNYETDYYYHTMREGAEWLQKYLQNKPDKDTIIIGSNFPVQWYFRNEKTIKLIYFPYQSRSQFNWDYAIVANSYISPSLLTKKVWPPANTIHTIFADGVPVCAVIERVTKDDLYGIRELKRGENIKSALLFEKASELDPQNEMICYKFAESLAGQGKFKEAEQQLDKSLAINPEYDQALVLKGDLELKKGNNSEAASFYEQAIVANRKYFSIYPKLATIYTETNASKARKVLGECLKINPHFKPALQGMADLYRETNPEKAEKFDKLINKLK
jgi:tetratricopeptide (TPR) repeat protein